jgi:hypothetical protein
MYAKKKPQGEKCFDAGLWREKTYVSWLRKNVISQKKSFNNDIFP